MTTDLTIKLAKARLTDSVDAELAAIFQEALRLGVGAVEYVFSGSGDSGDINSTTLKNFDHADLSPNLYTKVQDGPHSYHFESSENPAWTPDHEAFESKLNHFFDDYISDRIDWDWYNNEGGGGTAVVDFQTGQVDISGYFYVQSEADGVCYNIFGEEE